MNQSAKAPTKLDSVSFDLLLREQDPFGVGNGKLDLRGVKLVTPAAQTQLAAALHALAVAGRDPELIIDEDSVRSYLVRSGFVDVVSSSARIFPPLPDTRWLGRLHGSNPMLIEVSRIESGSALPDLLDRIVWSLRYRLRYRKRDAFDVATAISEIAQNTFDHNSGTCGFLAMQVYGGTAKRFLEIGVADYGEGITSTLRRNPKNGTLGSDIDAIQKAMKLGVSEHDDPTRGAGLFHLLEIAYKHEGSVQIRSGEGKVRYRMDKKVGWTFAVPRMPGVQVAFTLPAKFSTDQ